MVTAGPNGIVTTAPGAVIAAMESLDEGIIMARPTYITGHRGQPGDTTENTLSSAKHAYVSGANAIENDVYLTTDGVLVIDHDGTTGRLYNQNLTVERCTWAELQALSFKNPVNLEDGEGMATLEQFFTEFKGKDVVHFIEIKSSQTAIVAAVKAPGRTAGRGGAVRGHHIQRQHPGRDGQDLARNVLRLPYRVQRSGQRKRQHSKRGSERLEGQQYL